jgi:hypothetical protein
MQCRNFEDSMSRYFGDVNAEMYLEAMAKENWSLLKSKDAKQRALIEHAANCSNCSLSLCQYLSIRDKVDYREYPCFHLAYYSVDEEDRCITQHLGLFEIILDKAEDIGIVIGACPWCGIKLNVSAIS